MRSFNTAEYPKYSFEVDGKAFFLPGITLSLFDKISEVQELEGADRAVAAVEFIRSLAPDKRTKEAIEKLRIADIGVLFSDWAGGLSVGESKSSVDSQ